MIKQYGIGVGVVAAAVVLVQGNSVQHGLLLDDYSHRAQMRDGDFSFRSLVGASHLGGHRRRVEMWWQDDADLYFFRPLAFLVMRAEYVVGGWRPEVMHGFSLAWAIVCGSLLMVLATQVLGSARWGGLAGVLFVLHPANYLTVRWVACQNEQMATAFLLTGMWCYGTWSGWWRDHGPERSDGGISLLVGTLLSFGAALCCRESSVVFVGMVVAGDWFAREAKWGERWGVYGALVGLTVIYLVVRHLTLGPLSVPVRPYAYPPSEPGFVRFAIDKFVYYVLGLFAYFPIVGFSGLRELRGNPVLFYGLFGVIVALWGAVLWWFRDRRFVWVWMGVIVFPLGPVLPVFASAHHLFLSSAGMVILTLAAWKWMSEWGRNHGGLGRWFRRGIGALMVLHVVGFVGANAIYDGGIAGFGASSQATVDEVASAGDSFRPNDRLFFVNLSMLAFNCVPGIEEATGVDPLRGYVLTFAPSFLGMDRAAFVEPSGGNRLRVWLEDEGYFSGLIGTSMLEAVDRDRPFAVGERFSTEDFEVRIVRGSEAGIQELEFTFERRLDDPTYHFFFGSRQGAAYPLRFGNEDLTIADRRDRARLPRGSSGFRLAGGDVE